MRRATINRYCFFEMLERCDRGNVYLNYMFKNHSEIIKKFEFNGYQQTKQGAIAPCFCLINCGFSGEFKKLVLSK